MILAFEMNLIWTGARKITTWLYCL